MNFVHLRVRSEYSLLSSVIKMGKIVDFVKQNNPIALGLTDNMSLSGALEFSTKIAKLGTKPILGINAFILPQNQNYTSEDRLPSLTFLAKNEIGYQNLIRIMHKACFEYSTSLEQKYILFEDIANFCEGLICLSGGYEGLFGKHFFSNNTELLQKQLLQLKDWFGFDFYIELTRHGRKQEKEFEDFIINQAFEHNIPLVATNDVYFLKQDQFIAYDVLTCIKDGRYIYEKDRYRLNDQYYLKSEAEMIELFSDIPEAINNTVKIAQKCSFLLKERKPMLPAFVENGNDDEEFIKQAREGLEKRLASLVKEESIDCDNISKIETARCYLRPIEQGDFANLLLLNKENENNIFTPHNLPSSENTIEQLTQKEIEEYLKQIKEGFAQFVIFDKQTNEFAGIVNYKKYKGKYSNEYYKTGDVDFGYAILKKFQNKGIATEVAQLVLKIAFKNSLVDRLFATAHCENVASSRVLEKSGFKYLGEIEEVSTDWKIKWKVYELLKKDHKIHTEKLGYSLTLSEAQGYRDRLEFELDVIIKMGFAGYFLIVSDFIKWAKENNIPVGPGRGSGAGSIVAWALLITNLDPIYYGLLFERFLNPERVSMPDFDIDFCQDRRDEVINYVRRRYGPERVANIITFGKLQAKAALKDVGRVLHINYNRVDDICKLIPFSPTDPITIEKAIEMDPRLQEARLEDPDIQQMIDIAIELEGLGRHTSTHAAGIIIADRDLTKIAPIYKDLHSDGSVLGFHMKDAEKIGLVKFDFLGLKTLTVISDTCKLVEQSTGIKIDIDAIPINDDKTFELLRSTKLKGIFQLEAAIPREVLKQIATDRIEDLIAITSLNRPGPMDNMPLFVRRKTGTEQVVYLHQSMEETLKETFGIIIYQEQVMKIAQVFAGYTLGGADLLRRAMGKKIKEEMDAQRAIFVEGAKRVHNVNDKFANEVFDLVEKFAGYGFNKSHAAAYSVISYQTAYLKAHYPLDFFISMLNLDISNTDKLNEYVNDAKTSGIEVIPPDINFSEALFSRSKSGTAIVYGLAALKSVGLESAKKIVEIRNSMQ